VHKCVTTAFCKGVVGMNYAPIFVVIHFFTYFLLIQIPTELNFSDVTSEFIVAIL